jgi:membrane protein DedA with SNARE-associated domain
MIGLEILEVSAPWMVLMILFITLIVGDNIFLVLGFGFSQGYYKPWLLIVFFLAIVLTDYPFYLIGRSKYFERLKKIRVLGKFFGRVDDTLDFITGNHINLAFFYCKFISGAKPWINMYLGEKKVSQTKFIIMTLIAGIVWSIFAFIIGYISGQGFSFAWEFFESLSIAVLLLIIFFALFLKSIKKIKEYIHKNISNEKDDFLLFSRFI